MLTSNPALVRAADLPRFETVYRCAVPTFEPVAAASGSEESLHYASVENRRRETAPPVVVQHPTGMWALDDYGDLWHLEVVEIAALERLERPYGNIVAKYAAWIAAGQTPPPIRVLELQSGRLRVSDGHHRTAALEQAGATTIRAWVSPHCGGVGLFGLNHEEAVTEAVEQGERVPLGVVRDYPRVQRRWRELLKRRRYLLEAI